MLHFLIIVIRGRIMGWVAFRKTMPVALVGMALVLSACRPAEDRPVAQPDSTAPSPAYASDSSTLVLSRAAYADKLYGFWLGQCIANWTGLVTEMDKIGGDGVNGKAAGFYTRENWGGPDAPSLWEEPGTVGLSPVITFIVEDEGGRWGADDDTDIEYLYQHLMAQHQTSKLTPEQIRDGWLNHIYSDENTPFAQPDGTPENYLWVSNQAAHDLMRTGMLPPATSHPDNNPHYEMIDAQLTTEIFGLFAPARPDVALDIAALPIRTTARNNAAWIAEFYVIMHALASSVDADRSMQEKTRWMADEARKRLPDHSYAAAMYDFVKEQYETGVPWEAARDALHEKYQVQQDDGYRWSTQDTVCNGCFAAGINFGASIVSLLYGEGDLQETIKIGVLAGWDSDNPTATWGGLLGFMLGKSGVEEAFGRTFADTFYIHRTRGGFPNDGLDTFGNMAQTGLQVIDRVVEEQMGGRVDLTDDVWYIPAGTLPISPAPADM